MAGARGPGHTEAEPLCCLLLRVPRTRRKGEQPLASFLVLQFNDIFSAFLFSLLRARPVVLERVERPDSRAGWCQLLGAD